MFGIKAFRQLFFERYANKTATFNESDKSKDKVTL